MSAFQTHPWKLRTLLTMIDEGLLALPDFQRSFVWDPNSTERLIESIAQAYPAGGLLFIAHRDDLFALREFEGAEPLEGAKRPAQVVLDGQQRLTSLYQAFLGKGAHRYFVRMAALAEADVEEAVFHETEKRARRAGLFDLDYQARELVFPLAALFEKHGYVKWRERVVERRRDLGLSEELGGGDLAGALLDLHSDWLEPMELYEFPVVSLDEKTPVDAVCAIFEVLNNTGVQLSVFELLTARFWPAGVDLRKLWDKAIEEHRLLRNFQVDPYTYSRRLRSGSARSSPPARRC